jgi:hypothetical protein
VNPIARRADVLPAKGSALDRAAEFIDKICVRADKYDAGAEILRRYGKRARTYVKAQDLVEWINPDNSAGADLLAIRRSIVADVIQNDMYLPRVNEQLRYYRQQVDTFVTATASAARKWATEDLDRQINRVGSIQLAIRYLPELHDAALDVQTAARDKSFKLPELTPDETRAVTNESKRSGQGVILDRLTRAAYLSLIKSRREPEGVQHVAPSVPGKPPAARREPYRYLSYLMAHPRGVEMVDAYARSNEDGWRTANEIIEECKSSAFGMKADLRDSPELIWRFPTAVSVGIAQLRLGERPNLVRFALDWGRTLKSRLEKAIEVALNALFLLDLVGLPEVSGVLNFIFAAASFSVSYLRDFEQEQAKSATAFGSESEKLSQGASRAGTVLLGFSALAAAVALPGAFKRIKAGGEPASIARTLPDPRSLERGVGNAAADTAGARQAAGINAAAPEIRKAEQGLASRESNLANSVPAEAKATSAAQKATGPAAAPELGKAEQGLASQESNFAGSATGEAKAATAATKMTEPASAAHPAQPAAGKSLSAPHDPSVDVNEAAKQLSSETKSELKRTGSKALKDIPLEGMLGSRAKEKTLGNLVGRLLTDETERAAPLGLSPAQAARFRQAEKEAADLRRSLAAMWTAATPPGGAESLAKKILAQVSGMKASEANDIVRTKLFDLWRDRFYNRVRNDKDLMNLLKSMAGVMDNGSSLSIPFLDAEGELAMVGLDVDHAVIGHAQAVEKAIRTGDASALLSTVDSKNLQLLFQRENRNFIEMLRNLSRDEVTGASPGAVNWSKSIPLGSVRDKLSPVGGE